MSEVHALGVVLGALVGVHAAVPWGCSGRECIYPNMNKRIKGIKGIKDMKGVKGIKEIIEKEIRINNKKGESGILVRALRARPSFQSIKNR